MADEHDDDALLLYPEEAEANGDDGEENDGSGGGNDDDDPDDDSSTVSEMTVEPDCDRANNISFHMVARRMEILWQLKRPKSGNVRKVSIEEKKKCILPPPLLKALEPQSIFPLMRLLAPDMDNSRTFNMREKNIAQAYCKCLGLSKKESEMLYGYTDPHKVPHDRVGDFSLVIEYVLEYRRLKDNASSCTVGHINQYLDELAALRRAKQGTHNHDWRGTDSSKEKGKTNKLTLADLRGKWLHKVMNKGRLSPLVSSFNRQIGG